MEWYLLRMWLTKGKNFKRYQKVHVSGLESRVSSDVSKYPLGTRGNNFLKFPNVLWDAIGEFKPRSFGMPTKGSFTFKMLTITKAISESIMRLFFSWAFPLNHWKLYLFFWNNSHQKYWWALNFISKNERLEMQLHNDIKTEKYRCSSWDQFFC